MQKNQITFFLGNEIYSQFRKTALEDQVKNKNSEKISIDVNDIYVIESNTLLSESAKRNLQKILNSDKASLTNIKIGNNLFIGPRVGTISPWSSRATDIIKNCGISILRAEKLSLFTFKTKSNKNLSKKELTVVTKKRPTEKQLQDMIFAFKISRYVKSNSIVIVKNSKTLAIGAGQMSRIDSTNIAYNKSKKENISLKGAVLASEAFFPFRDNVDLAKKIGISAIIQPGGSINDEKIIEVANKHKLSMCFSHIRVFKH